MRNLVRLFHFPQFFGTMRSGWSGILRSRIDKDSPMSLVSVLAWSVAIYLSMGILVASGLALICWVNRVKERPDSGADLFRTWLMVFALWPCYVAMAAVFAILMLGQRRQ